MTVFTLEQINDLHDRYGRAATLADYLRSLRAIGVEQYDSYVSDGHTEFFGGGRSVTSPPAHERLRIAEVSDQEALLVQLKWSEEGRTSYLEMSKGLAAVGVQKWAVDTCHMTMTFMDREGHVMFEERIE